MNDKNSVTCNVGTTQYEDVIIKCEKKIMKPTNLTKVQSHMMLVLHNMRMVPSNVKKIMEPPNVTKVQSHVKLVLHKVRIIQLNVKKKKKENHQM